MRIFHIATLADWTAAQRAGSYTTSTLGRTLADEGFVHASRGDQWQGVRERYYAQVTEPLVLLVIDTDRLGAPVVDEAVPGSTETFPHVYGPIEVSAVVQTIALGAIPAPAAGSPSFSRLFFEEMFRNLLLASLVLACVVAATLLGLVIEPDWGPITGAAVGLVVGLVMVRVVLRRRPS